MRSCCLLIHCTSVNIEENIGNATIARPNQHFQTDIEKEEKREKNDLAIALKGYICYKTITSQNALSEAQVNNFFIF